MKKVTAFFIILLLCFSFFSVGVSAETEGKVSEDDFGYTIENGEATITDYYGDGGDVTIPATLGGAPVTAIGENAFKDCTGLTTIKLPNGVTTIGNYAFSWCNRLTSIDIPYSVTIGEGAFYGCLNLVSIKIPDSITFIGEHAFSECYSLSEITLPYNVTVGKGAFLGTPYSLEKAFIMTGIVFFLVNGFVFFIYKRKKKQKPCNKSDKVTRIIGITAFALWDIIISAVAYYISVTASAEGRCLARYSWYYFLPIVFFALSLVLFNLVSGCYERLLKLQGFVPLLLQVLASMVLFHGIAEIYHIVVGEHLLYVETFLLCGAWVLPFTIVGRSIIRLILLRKLKKYKANQSHNVEKKRYDEDDIWEPLPKSIEKPDNKPVSVVSSSKPNLDFNFNSTPDHVEPKPQPAKAKTVLAESQPTVGMTKRVETPPPKVSAPVPAVAKEKEVLPPKVSTPVVEVAKRETPQPSPAVVSVDARKGTPQPGSSSGAAEGKPLVPQSPAPVATPLAPSAPVSVPTQPDSVMEHHAAILATAWPEWKLEKELGRGSYGVVYQAIRADSYFGSRAAIKVVSIPAHSGEVTALHSEGLDQQGIRTYFHGITQDFVKEIQVMELFKGMQNIVSVEDYKVVEKQGQPGFDIFIRMELLTSFDEFVNQAPLTQQQVVQLGIDICAALEICNRQKVIHRDVKPENIFLNQYGCYKLGDFGIARTLENATAGLSQKGTYNYMAPEVANSNHYDHRVDIYSLGLVLHRLLNDMLPPFVTHENRLNAMARKVALDRRLQGEQISPPLHATPQLSRVILKACDYDPDKRYATAGEMKAALEQVARGGGEPQQPATPLDATVSVRSVQG